MKISVIDDGKFGKMANKVNVKYKEGTDFMKHFLLHSALIRAH